MTEEEIQSLISQLKAQEGMDDDKIMSVFYETFKQGKMNREDLEALAEAMGYELTDDFKNDTNPDPIENSEGEGEEAPAGDLEGTDALKPGETPEEFKERIDEVKEGGEDSDSEDEDKEWDSAKKLFRL